MPKPDGGFFRFGSDALKAIKPFGLDGLVFAVGIIVSCGALILKADPIAVVAVDIVGTAAYLIARERDAGRRERAAERELRRIEATTVQPAQKRLAKRLRANLSAPADPTGEPDDRSE